MIKNYQATTPEHFFVFEDVSIIDELIITYMQHGEAVLEKNKADLAFIDNTGGYKLTQEETNKFSVGKVSIQIRMKTTDGDVLRSENAMEFVVEKTYNQEVL